MKAHRDPHGPACIQTSVVDPDPIKFEPGRIRVISVLL